MVCVKHKYSIYFLFFILYYLEAAITGIYNGKQVMRDGSKRNCLIEKLQPVNIQNKVKGLFMLNIVSFVDIKQKHLGGSG